MPRITVNQPNPPDVYTKRYDKFLGVDYSTDPSRIDDSRSPHAVNIISDEGGYPEKRVGWRQISQIDGESSAKSMTIDFTKENEETPLDATIAEDGYQINTVLSTQDALSKWLLYRSDGSIENVITPDVPETYDSVFAIDFTISDDMGSGLYAIELTAHRSRIEWRKGILAELIIDDQSIGEFDYAAVTVGDEDTGTKRMKEINLSPGTHTLKIKRSPNDAQGGDTFYQKVYIWLESMKLSRADDYSAPINGIFWYGTTGIYLVHAGTKLYTWDGIGSPTVVYQGVKNAKSCALVSQQKMLILTGNEYLSFDGNSVETCADSATVPKVITGRYTWAESGTPPAGTALFPVNMLTGKRKIGFVIPEGDPNKKVFHVGMSITSQSSIKITYTATGLSVIGDTNSISSVDLENGVITLTNPVVASNPAGTDVIDIEFEHQNPEGYADRILHCTFMANYSNRIFYSGNPDYPNTDWYSELNDPFYISDLSYTQVGDMGESDGEGAKVGSNGSAIVGYARIGEQMVIFKEDNGQDATVFLRSTQYTDNGAIFPVKQGIIGYGLISRGSIATLHDDPMFLTRRGIYGISSENINYERVMQPRSTRVNAKLTQEKNIEQAVSCIWNGYYILSVNGNCYVADSRQKTYARNNSDAYEYEWYFWDNVHANVFCENSGALFFGTTDGRLCKFNTDFINPRGGYRMDAYNDNGQPIVAEWATKLDDDGDFNVLKSMRRRGSGVYAKTYDASNIKVSIRTDHDFGTDVAMARRGIFNFKTLDFANFTFNTFPHAFVMFNQKIKAYRLIQVTCRNDVINQGFGVYAIERRFVRGYFGK